MSFKKILSKLHNRYIYATLIFLIIILFIDQYNIFEQFRLSKALKEQKQQIEYLEKLEPQNKQYLYNLKHDTATQEKVAREEHMMKRDGEIIYIIETQK